MTGRCAVSLLLYSGAIMSNSVAGAGLAVHRAADAEVLAKALGDHLGQPKGDVFDPLVVTCEGPGSQRWLAHRLAQQLGIAAAITFPPFIGWAEGVLARAAGVDPATDPWRRPRLVWAVQKELDRRSDWAGTVLEAASPSTGRLWLAEHLTEVLLDYARREPMLLQRWTDGDDADVPPELAWQPVLWRRLLASVPGPDPVSRLPVAEEALRSGRFVETVPDAIHLWAPAPPAASHTRLLAALAAARPVEVWLPGLVSAADHPFAAAMNREQEATLATLAEAGAVVVLHPGAEAMGGTPPTLLDRLRGSLSAGRPATPAPLDPGDTSITLHSCHGPERQAEVLRDVLCGLLADDPTLEPRDVLVAVADPGLFPMLEAAFASLDLPGAAGHPARTLPVRFADPELRDHNALLTCLVDALRLGRGRAGVSELVDFLAADPVARRLGLDEDDLGRAHDMVTAAGVRWGMNAAHRRRFGLDGVTANTWLSGLNRLLVGIAMSEDGSHAVRSVLPLDDVGSSDIEVVGAVAELMVRLIRLARDAEEPHTPAEWVRICREALEALTAPAPEDAWQLDHAWQVLADIADAAAADVPPVPLDDLLDLLADALHGRPPRSAFRSGAITVCTLWPARHVPHRVVCVVGLDDGQLPRPQRIDGDNLLDLASDPRRPQARHRDRQVFLDLVRAARQHLVLTWTGSDPRSGEARPPAVALAELIDTLDAMVVLPDGASAREVLTTRHPLQPYAPEVFADPTRARYRSSAFTGFDPAAAAAARILLEETTPTAAASTVGPLAGRLRLPPWQWDGGAVPLGDVVDLLTHPARAFLRQRAGFTHWSQDDATDTMPLELDGLGAWAVGNRVLTAALRGDRLEDALRAETLRGTLPPGGFGGGVLDRVRVAAERILQDSAAARAEAPVTRHLRIPLTDPEVVLTADVTLRGHAVVGVSYSRVGPRHRLTGWFDLLALSAAGVIDRPRAHLFGPNDHVCLTAPDRDTSRALLQRWVDVATVGLTHPLPLPLKTGAFLATAVRPGTAGSELSGHQGLRDAWQRECDANWRQLWDEDLAAMVGAARPAGLPAIGNEESWMADLARGLWSPIHQAEERR